MFNRSQSLISSWKVQPQDYLYIPFSFLEHNDELCDMAERWRKHVLAGVKYYKAPKIVIHSEFGDVFPKPFHSSHKFYIDSIPPGSSIYILGHGMGDPCQVGSHSTWKKSYFLSVTEIANRLKADGLTPQLAKKLKPLRLFFCEKNNTNKDLAVNLALAMGDDYSHMNISYYEAKLGLPNPPKFSYEATPKIGLKLKDSITGDFEYQDNANKFKKTINVGDQLQFENNFKNLFSFP